MAETSELGQVVMNDAFIPLMNNTDRHLYLYGGAGSGKSWWAIQKFSHRLVSERPHKFIFLRKWAVDLKDSVVERLEKTLESMGIFNEFIINKTERSYKHLLTGNSIICKGLDDHHRVQSLEGVTGMFVEEATEFTLDDLDQLNLRIRGIKDNYVQYIYSFNPIDEKNQVVDKVILKKDKLRNSSVRHFTYHDNYYIDEEYKAILEGYKESNPIWYDVYCLGKPGVHDKSNKFLFNFMDEKHVGKTERNNDLTLRLSFDFNLDPYAVIIYQKIDNRTLRIIDKIKTSSDIEQVCDIILATYGQHPFIVTGDASGKARTGVVRGKTAYWNIVRRRLNLSDHQIKLRTKNIDHLESKLICNAALAICDIKIDPKCSELIQDCNYAALDDHGMLIKDRNHNKNDFLDTFRYLCDMEWPDIIVRPNKYK